MTGSHRNPVNRSFNHKSPQDNRLPTAPFVLEEEIIVNIVNMTICIIGQALICRLSVRKWRGKFKIFIIDPHHSLLQLKWTQLCWFLSALLVAIWGFLVTELVQCHCQYQVTSVASFTSQLSLIHCHDTGLIFRWNNLGSQCSLRGLIIGNSLNELSLQ